MDGWIIWDIEREWRNSARGRLEGGGGGGGATAKCHVGSARTHARVKPGGSVGLGGRGVETFTRSVRCPPSGRGRAGGRLTLRRQEGYAKCQLCKNNQSRARGHHTYASASGMDGG